MRHKQKRAYAPNVYKHYYMLGVIPCCELYPFSMTFIPPHSVISLQASAFGFPLREWMVIVSLYVELHRGVILCITSSSLLCGCVCVSHFLLSTAHLTMQRQMATAYEQAYWRRENIEMIANMYVWIYILAEMQNIDYLMIPNGLWMTLSGIRRTLTRADRFSWCSRGTRATHCSLDC